MRTLEIYVDEISNRRFDKIEDAIKSEKKNGGIKNLFAFWKYPPKDNGCNFANGSWCYQRTDVEYLLLKDALIKAINNYEPWIAKQYKEDGGLRREHLGSGFIIGRYLSDGNSELYTIYLILSNICPKCFREWGQSYYANHCSHNFEDTREVK